MTFIEDFIFAIPIYTRRDYLQKTNNKIVQLFTATFEDIDHDIRGLLPGQSHMPAVAQVTVQAAVPQVVDNPLVDEAREYWGDLSKTKAKGLDH